ncbi:MAG: MraY family glycosyltransferase [Nitrososphaerales archaeon]
MTYSLAFLFSAGLIASILGFLVCYLGTRFLISYLTQRKMTVLDYHKREKPQVPRPGGPAIVAGILAGELFLFGLSGSYAILGLILVTLISGLIGIVDDLKTLGGMAKPALLIVGGIPLVALEYFIPNASVYGSHLYLPLFSTPTNIPLLYPLLIMVSIPVTTNTINTIDVLNGVVSGFILIAFIPVTFAMFLRLWLGKENPMILLAILPILAAVGAFYIFHKYPSRIFPGDSGAIALGGAYGAVAFIGGVEIVAVIAILPAIMNSFFFLSSVKRLVEHRQIKTQPTILLPDARMIASTEAKAPITLVRLLVASKAMSEEEIVGQIFKLSFFCAFLAFLTAIMTWAI